MAIASGSSSPSTRIVVRFKTSEIAEGVRPTWIKEPTSFRAGGQRVIHQEGNSDGGAYYYLDDRTILFDSLSRIRRTLEEADRLADNKLLSAWNTAYSGDGAGVFRYVTFC